MATVQLIDGRIVENVRVTNIRHIGEEGSQAATAQIDGKAYTVYSSIVDGLNDVWREQMPFETWQMLKGTGSAGFVVGSADHPQDKP